MDKFIVTSDISCAEILKKHFVLLSSIDGTFTFINDPASAFYTEAYFTDKKYTTTNILLF